LRRLVTIDLACADLQVFEAYEAQVLPLMARHGGRLEMRVRTADGLSETHLLFFPDLAAYERYRSDPDRLALQGEWAKSGATSIGREVEVVTS
jgi:uncharacterized protein (DUF1330 family)